VSDLGKWSLGIGASLFAVVVFAKSFDFVPVAASAGLLGVIALGIAGYDAVHEALGRAELRRRALRVQQERAQGC
jgi:hypothetical protein